MKSQKLILRTLGFLFCLLLTSLAIVGPSRAQFNEPHVELNWYTIETPHFFVHYHEGTERTAQITAKVAEEVYGPVTSFYGVTPNTKVSFIIKDVADYSNGAAYYFDNKIEIWSNPLDFDLRGTHNWLRNVVSHEFTHIVQSQAAMKFTRRVPAIYLQAFAYESERRPDVLSGYPNLLVSYPILGAIVPAWFSEGAAQFNRPLFGYETWDAHRDMLLRMRALDNKLLTFAEMATFGKTTLGNESSYNQGFALTSYIAGQYGEEKLRDISKNMQSAFATSIDGAIQNAIGVSTDKLFADWASRLSEDYKKRVAPIMANRREGDTVIEQVGYMNLYPVFARDGKKFAYISNKTSDYTAEYIYLVDALKHTEERIPTEGTVYSRVTFNSNGNNLLYARRSPGSIYGDRFFDVYEWDLEKKSEHRLTNAQRATAPTFSKDESIVYFVTIKDGTSNLARVGRAGGKVTLLTHFSNGEQLYSPVVSSDGKHLLFDFAERDERQLAIVDTDGSNFRLLSPTAYDVRSPQFIDSLHVIVSSNRSGIFNTYLFDLPSGKMTQLTNVVGGAFMPAGLVKQDSVQLLFANFTSDGYKIHQVVTPLSTLDTAFASSSYIVGDRDIYGTSRPPFAVRNATNLQRSVQWDSLRAYNDTHYEKLPSTPYRNVYNGISFVPVLRFDNYNPNGKGLDNYWLGVYGEESDVTGRLSLNAGVVVNHNLERDLFAGVTSQSRLFSSFGFFPELQLSVSNSTRKPGVINESFPSADAPQDTVNTPYSINFLTFDLGVTHPIFNADHYLKVGYTYSIYTSRTEGVFLPNEQIQLGSSSDDYFKGSDLSLSYWTNNIAATRTHDINPVGSFWKLRLDLENNKLLERREIVNGAAVPIYKDASFLRLDGEVDYAQNIISQYDALGLHARFAGLAGTAFPVDSFYHFYGGGLTGLRGYPYYSLSGSHLASAQLRYFFPISNGLDFRLAQFYFDKLYVGVFADAAVAFGIQRDESFFDRFGSALKNDLRKDIGMELRLESFSWYSVPTAIFFSAAYGLDRFQFRAKKPDGTLTTVEYGKEMRYYAGVLFTFNFSQPETGGDVRHTYLHNALAR